ncbi:MAG: hypothetical protein E5V72_02065 [Mesorhizobium sp.]|uniref:hypothetical protein n=1 Tax=Mesorhizobium sp. TaxID=1871066 RepID=UPI000FEA11EC|nr:hypothetical protein [Mesorhizobium sp.]RWD49998.1 MAG: hypothetical protein EOS59_11970 [Mesorhizobium sp.]RWE61853.1 MAG: hypothetical protein EOS24_11025 [Mesorhizobium sp.]RWE86980.1 MAG: hypothetical protein EOS49_12035 [Mesorhizobium sp.]RWF07556.1 MAG: hypothetical protein EOS69_27805 [Mesorhizobium sp.]RWF22494.1 MAG: hypothetical protein EOS25_01700 [Mesorhizobium sp.]
MLTFGPMIVLAVIAIVAVIGLIPETAEDAALKFRRQCRADGMSFAETEAAIGIRKAFVQLRRLSSDQCVARGGKMDRDQINQIASHVAIGLAAAYGREAAKAFEGWIGSCPDEEILYDDARSARHHHIVGALREKGLCYPPKRAGMSEDFRNSFKVVR